MLVNIFQLYTVLIEEGSLQLSFAKQYSYIHNYGSAYVDVFILYILIGKELLQLRFTKLST